MKTGRLISLLTYAFFILVIITFVLAGYLIFLYFVTSVSKDMTTSGLLLVAIIAGVATFFNPCAFPFIPAYLTKYYAVKEKTKKNGGVIYYGVLAALGLITFNILLGTTIGLLGAGFGRSLALTGAEPSSLVRWLRGIVGVILLFLGFNHVTGRGLNFHKLQPKITLQKIKSPAAGIYWYGFLYNLIGIGCGGPILAGLSVFAFSSGGFSSALLAFAVYSFVMAFLMIIISLLVGFSKGVLMEKLKANTATIKKAAGVIVIIVGLFLIFSSIFTGIFTAIFFP